MHVMKDKIINHVLLILSDIKLQVSIMTWHFKIAKQNRLILRWAYAYLNTNSSRILFEKQKEIHTSAIFYV